MGKMLKYYPVILWHYRDTAYRMAESFVLTFLSSFQRLISRRHRNVLGSMLVPNGD
jgi:hypothetical protein